MLLGATVSDCNVEIALLGFCAFFIDEIAEDLLGRTSPRLNLCNVLGTGVELKIEHRLREHPVLKGCDRASWAGLPPPGGMPSQVRNGNIGSKDLSSAIAQNPELGSQNGCVICVY